MTTLIPLQDRLVVRRIEEKETSEGGIYIPDANRDKSQVGEVLSAGPGRYEHEVVIPMSVVVGDHVLFGKYAGTDVKIGEESFLIMREDEVLGVLLS